MNTLQIEQKTRILAITKILETLSINFADGFLMNREKLGIPLREYLVEQLYAMSEGTLVLNLLGVREMTTSVAEEIGPILFRDFIEYRERNENVYLTYCNVSNEIAKGLDGTFKNWAVDPIIKYKQSVVIFSSLETGNFVGHQFLGQEFPAALRDILDLIYNSNKVSSSDLEELGIKAASRKLTDITNYYPWLIRKYQESLETDSRAWAYFYSPIVPTIEE